MSSPYSTIANMQAAGWVVEVQSGTHYSATKQHSDNAGTPMHIASTSSAGLVNAADALRAHREGRGLHI